MANNHALDYGPAGMQDTFDAIAAYRFPVVGIGHDAAGLPAISSCHKRAANRHFRAVDWLEPALVPRWTATANRAGLAFSIDPGRLLAAVSSVRKDVDTLVVFLHWGTEGTHCASPEQHNLAELLAGAGADIIVGSHAHRVLELAPGHSFIAYGLGNFVWWREDGESGSSGILLVTATGRTVDAYSWIPARIHHGIPIPEHGGGAIADVQTWAKRRGCSGLSP